MKERIRSDDKVLEAGFGALREALGDDDGLRFLRLYHGGSDYTRERPFLIGDLSIDEMLSAIRDIQGGHEGSDASAGEPALAAAPGDKAG